MPVIFDTTGLDSLDSEALSTLFMSCCQEYEEGRLAGWPSSTGSRRRELEEALHQILTLGRSRGLGWAAEIDRQRPAGWDFLG